MIGATKEITLVGGAVVTIPASYKYSKCKKCPADDLIWAETANGHKMPVHYVDGVGVVSHFSDGKK
jgi:hypothetical protein